MAKELSVKNIITSIKDVAKAINLEFASFLNKLFFKNYKTVEVNLRNAVKRWVSEQPEIVSIKAGGQNSLAALFGIPPEQAVVAAEEISELVANSVVIKIDKFDKNLNGQATFYFQPSSLSNLLDLDAGYVITDKDQKLHWLDWLLTQGDTTIIIGYSYEPSNRGRSGGGTMETGGVFRVPPQFSGNINNNFITRAFQNREKEISLILEALLK